MESLFPEALINMGDALINNMGELLTASVPPDAMAALNFVPTNDEPGEEDPKSIETCAPSWGGEEEPKSIETMAVLSLVPTNDEPGEEDPNSIETSAPNWGGEEEPKSIETMAILSLVPTNAEPGEEDPKSIETSALSWGGEDDPKSIETSAPSWGGEEDPKSIETSAPSRGGEEDPKTIETRAPSRVGEKDPKSIETRAPSGGVEKDPKSIETRAPSRGGVKDPKSIETRAPSRGGEKDRRGEKDPKSIETRAPSRGGEKDPKSIETRAPSRGGEKDPKSIETRAPSRGGDKDPKSIERRAPSGGVEEDPKSIETRAPSRGVEEDPKSIETRASSRGGSSLNGAPDPKQDAIHLNSAFKGRGCNTAEIINIVANRDAEYRARMVEIYKTMYSEDLLERLSEELGLTGDVSEKMGVKISVGLRGDLFSPYSNNLKKAVMLWMLPPEERDAIIVGHALTLTSLDLAALTEVICSRTPSEIQLLRKAYFDKYCSQLEAGISFKTYGNHKKLLLACLDTRRDEGTVVNQTMAEADAKKLYKDGEGKWGTEERTFIQIFTHRNRAHLAEVASIYHRMYGNSLAKAVERETSGNFRDGLLTLLKCAENPAKYFAELLFKCMKGIGTRDSMLIRVVVTRAEIDMNYIKEEYAKIHGKSLRDAIRSDTSGHYRTLLLYLVGPVESPSGEGSV